MAKTASEFLDELARQELVAPHVLASLRKQVGHAAKPVAAATIARLLVEKKHLTTVQAERLLGMPLSAARLPAKAAPASPSLTETKPMEFDELGLAPLEEPAAVATPAQPLPLPQRDEPLDLELLDLLPLGDENSPDAASRTANQKPAAASTKRPTAPGKNSPAAPAPSLPSNAKTTAAALPPLEPLPLESLPSLDVLSPLDGLTPLDQPPAAVPLPAPIPLPLPSAASLLVPAAPQKLGTAKRLPSSPPAPIPKPLPLPVPALPTKPAAPRAGTTGRRRWWWVGIAAGMVLILAVGGIGAILLARRSNGDQELALAQQDYETKQYAAAAEKYASFLETFPRHPQAGLARVRRGMARILAARGSGGNWPAVLPIADEVLRQIDQEPELSQVCGDVAPVLTEMSERLVERALQADQKTLAGDLQQARSALALANNARYVPGSLRDWQRLAAVEETLALAERRHSADEAMAGAAAGVKSALTGDDLDKAFAAWDALLADFPELADDARLAALGAELANGAAASVRPITKLTRAESTEHGGNATTLATIAHLPTSAASGPVGTYLAQAGSSLWGLDAASGKVLWRRPVGSSAKTTPVSLSADESGDALLIDGRRHEILRVNRQTGALVWRHALDAEIAGAPLVIGKRIIVTTRDGQVVSLAGDSGNASAAVQLPALATTGPAASAAGPCVYQLADRNLLYVLSAEDLKCLSAVYLGHPSRSVSVPPLVAGKRLLIAANDGISESTLLVIPLDSAGLPSSKWQRLDLAGLVSTPLITAMPRVLVPMDRSLVMLDIPAGADEPVKQSAELNLDSESSLARFGIAIDGRFCTADVGLTGYDSGLTQGGLKRTWQCFAADVFETSPRVKNDVVLCARRSPGRPGWMAAAVKSADGAMLWETPLSVPISEIAAAGDKSLRVVTALGGVATIGAADAQHSAAPLEVASAALRGKQVSLAASIALAGSRLLVPTGQPRELLLLDAQGQTRPVELPDPIGGLPIAGAEGFLVPCSTGAIYWVNGSGALTDAVFQMRMAAGERLDRCSAAAGESGKQFVVSDGRRAIYFLSLEGDSQPKFSLLAAAETRAPQVTALAVLEDRVHAIAGNSSWETFSLPDLKPAKNELPSNLTVALGPYRIGKSLFAATDRRELICIDASGSIRWKASLHDDLLAGAPCESSGNILAATTGGHLLLLAADSGQELAHVDVDVPLAGAPLALGEEVIAATADGCLLSLRLPEKGAVRP